MKWIDRLMGMHEKGMDFSDPQKVPKVPEDTKLARWSGIGQLPLTVKEWMSPITTTKEQAEELNNMSSFSDLINARMDLGGKYVLMDDLKTIGAVFEITPIVADARSEEYMNDILDKIIGILKDSIPRDAVSPWMMNVTLQDEGSMEGFKNTVSNYPQSEKIHNSEFTQEWTRILREHLDDVSDPNGLFEDRMVSGGIWYARYRKVRLYLWRKDPNTKKDHAPELGDVIDQLKSRFQAANIKVEQKPPSELYYWLSRFFVPANKDYIGFDIDKYLERHPYHDNEHFNCLGLFEDGATGDLVKDALHGQYPYSDEKGNWWFNEKPIRFVTVEKPTTEPQIGAISAELKNGDQRYALWDKMPTGAIYSQTIIFEAEDVIEEELAKMEANLIGSDEKSKMLKAQVTTARQEIANGNVALKSFVGVYVQGDDSDDLNRKLRQVTTWLDASGLKTIDPKLDLVSQDCFLRGIPFNFDRDYDRHPTLRRARKYFVKHLAKIIPFYGRSRGTGNPGFLFFNRGGEPFSFDPLKDRAKNAFALILGPTGSGKSALLNFIIAQYVAFYKARFFIIEKGKSFYLLGKFLQKFGVVVHQVTVTPDKPISLNPFNDACKLKEITEEENIDESGFETKHDLIGSMKEDIDLEDSTEDDQRDELGEMIIAAITMITGGEEKELDLIRRHERFDIMQAIVLAGKNTIDKGYTLPEDISKALFEMSKDPELSDKRCERLVEFSDNMKMFCSGVRGKFFNRPGETWPDADVTIFDIGMMVSDEYADMLGVSMISMLNKVISIAEANQYTGRPIITLADEGHITTTNPLIAPIVTNMTKMSRKLNLWFWLATQNLSDFKDSASKMLSNMEWWITMSTTQDEVEQISRFKALTKDQELLLLAARKEPGKYTEGVVMSDDLLSLFRNVPPSIAMALAQTEGHEKLARKKLMDKHGISELDAAYMIADQMRERRKKPKNVA
ncbi:conjugative transfer ATPase [Hydrogenovibrio sp. SC-1]|uniref:conjugative transfer ATPase n=1 Tax=Hydrogenovibrio sp. SC-1 TaxID=2065820 RepID=UPI000C79B337|nr:conjugative transfer ATPase [Hydrogenovibrio sp. SC-1]PLA73965.1 conjugative transfer ATPase [Hydrogenovibrio sp. SC-1]